MKKQLKPWLYLAVVLGTTITCKTQDPCPDGSCCGASTQKLSYFTTVENARADVGFVGLILEDFKNTEFDICLQQRDLYENKLQTSYDFRTGQLQPFKYRVWGKIYNCDNCPVLTVNGVLQYIYIEKIEKIN